jgi:hypothetical protein
VKNGSVVALKIDTSRQLAGSNNNYMATVVSIPPGTDKKAGGHEIPNAFDLSGLLPCSKDRDFALKASDPGWAMHKQVA